MWGQRCSHEQDEAAWPSLVKTMHPGGIYGALALVRVGSVSLSVSLSSLCFPLHIPSFRTVLDWSRKARTLDLCP